eukprot:CAMPEP_0177671424 /NCGR_PEP_ID=MMETSP0447-20121125/24698_1 /TAXON_ID=0 /ORGANISM="Stygamoeba regulata, Strain BSH-02190019" /LENGTH=56 /DNA_ID=CAMNT_0019178819 /DNA_START=66 /DNA_END=233 /DNA_ORIENTATION=+
MTLFTAPATLARRLNPGNTSCRLLWMGADAGPPAGGAGPSEGAGLALTCGKLGTMM